MKHVASCLGIITVTTTMLFARPGHAFSGDGNMLLDHCGHAVRYAQGDRENVDLLRLTACRNYVEGMYELNELYGLRLQGRGMYPMFCPPEQGLATERAVRIVHDYLESHPEMLDHPMSDLVATSLASAFPCTR